MNDLQARLAGMGEAERAAAAPTAPELGNMLGGVGPGSGDHADSPMQLHAAIAAAPPERQAVVLQRLRLIDQIAQAIQGQTRDPVERARMAQHIAQIHPEMGIDPGMLTPQAMSDANIAALHELANEATFRVALANLGAQAVPAGAGAIGQSAGTTGLGGTSEHSPAQRFVPTRGAASHAAQGFTILGVE